MRTTTITAFGAGFMLIAAASLAAATPGLAQGSIGDKRSVLLTTSKTFATQRAIGDPSIKLKNFRKRRAFNPQPDPPGKWRATNPPDSDKRKTRRRK